MKARKTWEVRQAADTICETCEHALILRTSTDDIRVYCEWMQRPVPRLVECSQHRLKGTMSRSELESIAYFIDLKKKIGFDTEVRVIRPGTDEHKRMQD